MNRIMYQRRKFEYEKLVARYFGGYRGRGNRGKTSKFARVSHLLHGAKAAADTRWRRDAAGGMRNNTRKSET